MIFQVDQLLVLFGRKILSVNIGVSFKLWVFKTLGFLFYFILRFYPLVLEFISSCEFSTSLRLHVLFSPRVLSVSIGVSFKLWVFKQFGSLFYLVLRFYPIVLEFLSRCEFSSRFYFLFHLVLRFYPLVLEFLSSFEFSSQPRLHVLFCPKVLSTSIGVYFKLWVSTSQSFMFYLVLGFYPLVLEFLSSFEFSSNFGFLFYLDVRFYPIVLEFLSSFEFSPTSASCFI